MKNLLFFCALFFLWSSTHAQINEPVVWKSEIVKISDSVYEVKLKGSIASGWHVFSQFSNPDGAMPTELHFAGAGENFELIGAASESATTTSYNEVFEVNETYFLNTLEFSQRIKIRSDVVHPLEVTVNYQVCNEVCMNKEKHFTLFLNGDSKGVQPVQLDEKSALLSESLLLNLKHKERLIEASVTPVSDHNLLKIFILGFLGGLLALLTPCVFPMIPLTVSFFTKQAQHKAKGITHAMVYGLFIILIYIGLSIPFHFLDTINPELLNNISTNIGLNVFFFVIFLFFAFSFFGYYELTLPHSWTNRMDSASNIGGFIGIFFMALTLALVSFSCTGPILGSLLAGSLTSDGGAFQLTAGMCGFGVALALPFTVFALFPNLMKAIPKSGGWLTSMKVTLGFIELALALKFLSNADLVGHWGLLKREIFLGIWILIFSLMALYFFGIIRFPHTEKMPLKFPQITIAIVIMSGVLYLGTGLVKDAPLKLLSGFPPPSFYSIYEQESECPLGLNCFKDFDEGLAYAKLVHKPILLDFTGWACVNCRKMEENVWSDPKVFALLKNDYVLISLYIDDRKKLLEEKQFQIKLSDTHLKTIETIGDKWATFQYLNFNTASQPYYVTIDTNLKILNEAKQYANTDEYYNWLKTSLER